MAEIKNIELVNGVEVTAPNNLTIPAPNTDAFTFSGPGQTVVTDIDDKRDMLITVGSTSFTFVDGDVTVGTDRITEATHGMLEGDPIILTTTGVLPDGLDPDVIYFVRNPTTNDFQLSLSQSGGIVDISNPTGGGTHTVARGTAVILPTAGDNSGRRITLTVVDSGSAFACFVPESGEDAGGNTDSLPVPSTLTVTSGTVLSWEIIAAGETDKWRIKTLFQSHTGASTDLSATTNNGDFKYDNLIIGKVYTVSFIVKMTIDGASATQFAIADIKNGALIMARTVVNAHPSSTVGVQSYFETTFKATATDVTFTVGGSFTSLVTGGVNDVSQTHAKLIEHNNIELTETTEFD